MIRQNELLLGLFFGVLLIWVPLPFGGVTPWARTILIVATCLLAMIVSVRSQHRSTDARYPAFAILATAFCGFRGGSTWDDLLLWAALALVFYLSSMAAHPRRLRQSLWVALALSGLFQVLYGTSHWFARSTTIWGQPVPNAPQRLRGTFVNPDHLALYFGLLLPVVLAYGWRYLQRSWAWETKVLVSGSLALLWLTFFTCLAFTGSRAGLLAALATVLVQGLILVVLQRKKRWIVGGFLTGTLGLLFVAWVGLAEGLGRLFSTSAYEIGLNVRLEVFRTAAQLGWKNPWFGLGLDRFRIHFEALQPLELKGTWHHVHCDWLELFLVTGVFGFAAFCLALGLVLRNLIGKLRLQRQPENQAIALGALGSLVYAGLHELLDFGLTMPANAFTLAVICGLAFGLRSKRRKRSKVRSPAVS